MTTYREFLRTEFDKPELISRLTTIKQTGGF